MLLSLKKKERTFASNLSISIYGSAIQGGDKQRSGYTNNPLFSSDYATPANYDPSNRDIGLILTANAANSVDTEVYHHAPLQLGFSIAFPLRPHWSISTELTYTRLATDIESGSNEYFYQIRQRLYYVGLPLQIHYNILISQRINLYVASGSTIEKCVSGEQTTTYQVSEAHRSNNGSSNRIGRGLWQWSLNASAGVQLNILPKIGLYFEHGITWYAPDGSSLPNPRHDKPWQFTMKGGLRYTLSLHQSNK